MEYASKIPLINNLRLFGIKIDMSYLIFNTDLYSFLVTKRCIFATALILKIIILSFILCSASQHVFAENNSSQTDRRDYFEFKENIYKIPNTDVQVNLLTGWKGINLSSFILTSPGGLDAKTGEAREKIPVFMTVGYFSPESVFKAYNVTTLEQFVHNIAKTTKCAVENNGKVRINEFNGYKIRINCEPNKLEGDNILNYFFPSNGKVVFLSLKGTNPYFYRNIEKFEESVKTIRSVH
jgi:hypothetical protein